MTRRILPREDYGRLVGTYLEPLIDRLPADADVIVVEDADGQIVACSSIFARDHVECTWIEDGHRNSPGVFWQLFRGIKATAKRRGSALVLTAAMDDRMSDFLASMRAERIPGVHYVWPIGKDS